MIEVAIVGILFVLYNAGRVVIIGQESLARANAGAVRTLEAKLQLPSEAAIQSAVSSVPHLFEAANRYYMVVHFPAMIAFLLWGFLRRPRAEYVWARNLAVIMTFSALAIHMLYPLAPPRMFPEWGFVDTMTAIGPSPYEGASGVANQFAAMPSLHIGWALLIAYVLCRTTSRPLALLAVAHAMITTVVVVITANHWFLDGAVAAGLLVIALVLLPGPSRRRLPAFLPRERSQPATQETAT
ncbi:MAG: phosphatase PAP2 family protein [Nocardioides sp.]